MKKFIAIVLLLGCFVGCERELVVWVSRDKSDTFVDKAVVKFFEDEYRDSENRNWPQFLKYDDLREAFVLTQQSHKAGIIVIQYSNYKPYVVRIPGGIGGTIPTHAYLEYEPGY